MNGFRYEQGTPVKSRKPLSRAWCMKLAASIMAGSRRSVNEDAAHHPLAAAARAQQRLLGRLVLLRGQVALLGLLELGRVLEPEDLVQGGDRGLDGLQALAGEDLAGGPLHRGQRG